MADLKSRLQQEMNEKVGTFEKLLRKMQQDYPQSADGFQRMQHQEEQVLASDLTELTLQQDEKERVEIELQQWRRQQERQIEQMKAQQIIDIARRMKQQQREMSQTENSTSLILHR